MAHTQFSVGDIGAIQVMKVITHGTPVAADFFKLAHHGSDGSSGADFLDALAPSNHFW
jgi:beta-lactamase superfamily II metal-dependent hydrolase